MQTESLSKKLPIVKLSLQEEFQENGGSFTAQLRRYHVTTHSFSITGRRPFSILGFELPFERDVKDTLFVTDPDATTLHYAMENGLTTSVDLNIPFPALVALHTRAIALGKALDLTNDHLPLIREAAEGRMALPPPNLCAQDVKGYAKTLKIETQEFLNQLPETMFFTPEAP